MSTRQDRLIPRARPVLGMLLGAVLASPGVHAGGAVILLPVEDADAPKGSQISDERVQQIEKKIGEYKEQMRQEATRQQQQQAPAKQPAGPKPVKPG